MVTTLLEILACVLFAAGVAIVAGTLIGGGVGVGVGCILRRCRSGAQLRGGQGMSLLFKRELSTAAELIGQRYGSRRGNVTVNAESALAHSAVWACLRLRADLISTLPVDVFPQRGRHQRLGESAGDHYATRWA